MLEIQVDLEDPASIEAALDTLIGIVADDAELQTHLDEVEHEFQPSFGPSGPAFEAFSSEEKVITNLAVDEDYREERTPSSEWIFFNRAVEHPEVHEKILAYVRTVMARNASEVLWTDKSPGLNILHGQWSSPAVGVLGGVPQVLFGGGDGWMYSFRADRGQDGKPELLWKFDANPKESKWILGGRGVLVCLPIRAFTWRLVTFCIVHWRNPRR